MLRTSAAAAAAAAVVPELEGVALELAPGSKSGYRGVSAKAGGYCAVYKGTYVGKKPTAAEAALLYARHKAAAEAAEAAAAGGGDEGEEEADEEAALAAEGWRAEGHEWVGRRVLRYFGKRANKPSPGLITRWQPPDEKEPDALWHMVHDDGDEEDLDEAEVNEAIIDEEDAAKAREADAEAAAAEAEAPAEAEAEAAAEEAAAEEE